MRSSLAMVVTLVRTVTGLAVIREGERRAAWTYDESGI